MTSPTQYQQPAPTTPQAPTPQYGTSQQETHPIDMPYYGASFGEAIKRFFVKYATFSGRASKSEYWWNVLFLSIISTILETIGRAGSGSTTGPTTLVKTLTVIWGLATFIPSLAICVRRLHDANKSGWFFLLPVALMAFGAIIAVVAGLGATLGAASGKSGFTATGGIGLIVALILMIAGGILNIVLMCLHTDPQGVRFDKH